jgi:hypothetical protein
MGARFRVRGTDRRSGWAPFVMMVEAIDRRDGQGDGARGSQANAVMQVLTDVGDAATPSPLSSPMRR